MFLNVVSSCFIVLRLITAVFKDLLYAVSAFESLDPKLLRFVDLRRYEKMKKIWAILLLALVVLSTTGVMAAEETSTEGIEVVVEEETRENKFPLHPVKWVIEQLMDKYELSEDDSIGDLLEAIENEIEDRQEDLMEMLGVETEDELEEALKTQKIERIKEVLDLDEDLSDQEVLEIAKETRQEEVRELLGLDEDASKDEVKEAMDEWKQENHWLLPKLKHRFRFMFP